MFDDGQDIMKYFLMLQGIVVLFGILFAFSFLYLIARFLKVI